MAGEDGGYFEIKGVIELYVKCLGTGSKGNCYALVDSKNNILLLDAGISLKDIKIGVDFRICDIKGALITHHHKDHSLAAYDLDKMGVKVIAPYVEKPKDTHIGGGFLVAYFPLTDNDGKFVHSNGDSSECPVYGYMIQHDNEPVKLLYITDCAFVRWRFKDIDNMIIGIDYSDELVSDNNKTKNLHIYNGHMELKTGVDFIKTTDRDKTLKNIIIGHMSETNSDQEIYEIEIKKVTNSNLYFAKKGGKYELM